MLYDLIDVKHSRVLVKKEESKGFSYATVLLLFTLIRLFLQVGHVSQPSLIFQPLFRLDQVEGLSRDAML